MTEELLHLLEQHAAFEQVLRNGVAKQVRVDTLTDASPRGRGLDDLRLGVLVHSRDFTDKKLANRCSDLVSRTDASASIHPVMLGLPPARRR